MLECYDSVTDRVGTQPDIRRLPPRLHESNRSR